MSTSDRREFLKQLAKTATYSVPVVYTVAAPRELLGQGKSSEHKGLHGHGPPPAPPPGAAPAPWDQPPPGTPP